MTHRVVYAKDCVCKFSEFDGPAARYGAFHRYTSQPDANDVTTMTLTFVPGPSCNRCGKPWKRES